MRILVATAALPSPRVPAWLALLALLTSLAGAPRAVAAPTGAGAPDRQARELFQKAEMSFNLGKFSDALTDYQAAYEAKPLPAFLFNIAQCYRNLQNPERARFFYRRYLALDPRTPNRRLVEGLIDEMSRALDSQAAAPAAPAVAPAAMAPAPAPAAPAPAPAPVDLTLTARSTPPAAAGHPIYKRWWFWAGVGAVVAAGVIVGIVATRPGTPGGSLGPIDAR